jgi:hypothetical protein
VRTFDEIVQIVLDMQRLQGPTILAMKDVLDRYDGDWVLPIPSMDDEPSLPPLTPMLVGEAVDQMAMRAASVRPTVTCAAIDPSKDTGRRSRAYATKRRRILAATYSASKWNLGRRRFYRQLSAYYTGSLVVIPNFDLELPMIEVRDPLGTYVEPQANEQLRVPEYVCFLTRHSGEYLRARFPKVRSENGGPVSAVDTAELWDVMEWYDTEQTLWGLVGPVRNHGLHINQRFYATPWMQLSPSYPNKAGVVPAVVPHNVSLGKIASRIGSLLGNVDLQAKLTALDILAQEKAIFPDTFAIGRQNGMPQIVGGVWKDGREGEVNMLMDVEQIGQLRSTPDIRTTQLIDRLERNFRTSTGLVPQFGGETYGALRTGRGIDALAGMAVDPRVQELHEIDEAYMPHLNEAIFNTYKGYWPDKKYVLFSGWAGDLGEVVFTPSEHIETTNNTVSYAIAGADVIQQTQILGSLLGTGSISRKTFRAKHPWIDDPDSENSLVEEEQIEDALKQSILQKLASGQIPVTLAVKIRNYIVKGMDIFAAVEQADKDMREMQATPAPPPPEGMMASPEAMPGLAAQSPEMMAQQPTAPAPEQQQVEVPGDVSRMRQLMQVMGG